VEMNDAVIKKVLDRMNAKIQKLITQYEPDPEKFIAVFYTAIRAWKQSSIFIETPELSVFQSWAEKTREHYMDKLARAHEYKAFSAALEIDRIYSVLLGMNDESLLQQIIDAMTFQVSFDGKIVQSDGGGTYTWSSEGEAKDVRWAGDLRDGSYLHLIGTGEGKHKEYSTTSDSTINSTRKKNFTFDVSVLPDPCDTGRVKVDIKKFGPDTLTYIDSETGGEVEMASQYSYMWIMLDIFNREEGGFAVVMDLADGVAEFEGTLGGTYENGKISYTIRLQHTPK
ncbi:MAG: hypothetical protein PHX37_04870, partial [Eubacteriales bacterium]|nr:hypothetical protein [Eubacteriales bacterium]